jgi:DNA-directed RNA polymerase II subunit RPB7
MRFDPNSNPPSFASDEQVEKKKALAWTPTDLVFSSLQIIEKNTRVRLKIVGTRVDATEIVRFHR